MMEEQQNLDCVIKEVQKLSLKKGDILVMKVDSRKGPGKVSTHTLKTIKNNFEAILKANGHDNEFLLFNGDVEFSIIDGDEKNDNIRRDLPVDSEGVQE